jgi:hypothetical protein
MVFSALTLEAYINQQYASHKEISKFDLRKFEVREKWKMLPLLLGLTGGKTEVPGFLSGTRYLSTITVLAPMPISIGRISSSSKLV